MLKKIRICYPTKSISRRNLWTFVRSAKTKFCFRNGYRLISIYRDWKKSMSKTINKTKMKIMKTIIQMRWMYLSRHWCLSLPKRSPTLSSVRYQWLHSNFGPPIITYHSFVKVSHHVETFGSKWGRKSSIITNSVWHVARSSSNVGRLRYYFTTRWRFLKFIQWINVSVPR